MSTRLVPLSLLALLLAPACHLLDPALDSRSVSKHSPEARVDVLSAKAQAYQVHAELVPAGARFTWRHEPLDPAYPFARPPGNVWLDLEVDGDYDVLGMPFTWESEDHAFEAFTCCELMHDEYGDFYLRPCPPGCGQVAWIVVSPLGPAHSRFTVPAILLRGAERIAWKMDTPSGPVFGELRGGHLAARP